MVFHITHFKAIQILCFKAIQILGFKAIHLKLQDDTNYKLSHEVGVNSPPIAGSQSNSDQTQERKSVMEKAYDTTYLIFTHPTIENFT